MPEDQDAPRPLVRGRCWQDTPVGWAFRTASRTVTETDLVNFVTLGGFSEPLFWDARHSAASGYQGRVVPGALTYTLAEGLVMQSTVLHGTGLAFLGMELEIRGPVFVGDTIDVTVEVTESRPTSKGDERGIVTTRNTVRNQRGEDVLVYTPVRLVRGRTSSLPT